MASSASAKDEEEGQAELQALKSSENMWENNKRILKNDHSKYGFWVYTASSKVNECGRHKRIYSKPYNSVVDWTAYR